MADEKLPPNIVTNCLQCGGEYVTNVTSIDLYKFCASCLASPMGRSMAQAKADLAKANKIQDDIAKDWKFELARADRAEAVASLWKSKAQEAEGNLANSNSLLESSKRVIKSAYEDKEKSEALAKEQEREVKNLKWVLDLGRSVANHIWNECVEWSHCASCKASVASCPADCGSWGDRMDDFLNESKKALTPEPAKEDGNNG